MRRSALPVSLPRPAPMRRTASCRAASGPAVHAPHAVPLFRYGDHRSSIWRRGPDRSSSAQPPSQDRTAESRRLVRRNSCLSRWNIVLTGRHVKGIRSASAAWTAWSAEQPRHRRSVPERLRLDGGCADDETTGLPRTALRRRVHAGLEHRDLGRQPADALHAPVSRDGFRGIRMPTPWDTANRHRA